MKKIEKILVPVDFSGFSDKAVEAALILADKYEADICLLHVIVMYQDTGELIQFKAYEEYIKEREQLSRGLLKSRNKDVEKQGIAVESKLLRGLSAADTILEYMADNDFDLVVMGTHGRSGLKRWFYGNVTEKVLRHASIPVLTTHHELEEFTCENILVPVDFSNYSKEASEAAVQLARKFNSNVTFLHVIEQGIHPSFYAADIDSLFALDASLRVQSIERLKQFVGIEDSNHKYAVTDGIAHREIVKYANEQGADLIVISSHGLTGLEHLLIGSTTERVVRVAPCPVLTIQQQFDQNNYSL